MNTNPNTCNICGGTTFKPGHNGRLTPTGKNPECVTCGSVERQRIIHNVFSSFPQEWFINSALLQIPKDKAINNSLFHRVETVSFDGFDSVNMLPLNLPYKSYDWISCNHLLQRFLSDTLFFQELLRVLRTGGVIQLCVPSPRTFEKTRDWGYPDSKISGSYRIYGMDVFERFIDILDGFRIFSTVSEDPVSETSDILYFVTENKNIISHFIERADFAELPNSLKTSREVTDFTSPSKTNVRIFNAKNPSAKCRAFTYWETPSTTSRIPPYILLGLANMSRMLGEQFCLLTKSNLSDYVQNLDSWKDWRFSTSSDLLTSELMTIVAKSDFLRMRTVYELGGVWMDADSIVLKDFSSMLNTLTHKLTWHSEQFFGALPGQDILKIASDNMLKAPLQKWGNPGGIKDIIQRNPQAISHLNWKTLLDPNYKIPYNYKSYDIMINTDVGPEDFLCNKEQILLKMYNSGFIKYDIAKQTVEEFLDSGTLLSKIFLSLDSSRSRWIDECNSLTDQLAYRH